MNPIESVLNNPPAGGLYSAVAEDVAGAASDIDQIVEEFEVGTSTHEDQIYFIGVAQLHNEYRGLEQYDENRIEVEADLFPAFHRLFRNMTSMPEHLGGINAERYVFTATDGEYMLQHEMDDKEVEALYNRANEGADIQNRGKVDEELDMNTLMLEEASMEERFAQEYLREFTEGLEKLDASRWAFK